MRRAARCLGLLLVGLGAQVARADPPPEGQTYTPEELRAIDRALHAVNATRADLRFRKDVAQGKASLPLVRRLLDDPLEIAPAMDRAVRDELALEKDAGPAVALLLEAASLLDEDEFDDAHRAGAARVARDAALADPAVPDGPQALLDALARTLDDSRRWVLLGEDPMEEPSADDARLVSLRLALPPSMALHDVFASPFDAETTAKEKKAAEARPPSWLDDLASRIDTAELVRWWLERFHAPRTWLGRLPLSLFPTDHPLVMDTPHGRVALGTPGDDVYHGDYAILIDPAGNDRYIGCRIGAAEGSPGHRIGFFADLGGDDVYDCGDVDVTLGAAILGIAAFYDLGAGNDRYVGGYASLGAAMGGVAVFVDDGGSDVYEGKAFTQGAAGFGIGIFLDDAVQDRPVVPTDQETADPIHIGLFDNDRLHAWCCAQAFARCRGVALCVNRRGNDVYEAGGVYLDAPLFPDRYQSFSQGFAIGDREVDYAGGIALLIDHEGNDRYLGDIYDQGVGYWYSAGLLWDGGGNDLYEMTQYGQGSGIHLAVGGLVDVAGNDTYVMHSGLGQGGSHDYADSVLHDRGGSDRYLGNTSCNGTGLTNAVGLFIDRAGDDLYAARRGGSLNGGRPARGFPSLGLFVDLGGHDDYLGVMKDDETWRSSDVGVGVDVPPPAGKDDGSYTAGPDRPSEDVQIPDVVTSAGPLSDASFEALWALACRWEVGDNRVIVPAARKRLVSFGPAVLERMDAKVGSDTYGLDLRAFVDVLRGLEENGATDPVTRFLEKNARSPDGARRRSALYLIGELEARPLEGIVVSFLGDRDRALRLRAASVLASLHSHAGDPVLRRWLAPGQDEREMRAALAVLIGLGADAYDAARPLLAHPLFTVRESLAGHLAAQLETYRARMIADLGDPKLSPRARRTLLDAFVRAPGPVPMDLVAAALALFDDADWGMRADAVRVLRHVAEDEKDAPEVRAAARDAVAACLEHETDPYVRFVGQASGDR